MNQNAKAFTLATLMKFEPPMVAPRNESSAEEAIAQQVVDHQSSQSDQL